MFMNTVVRSTVRESITNSLKNSTELYCFEKRDVSKYFDERIDYIGLPRMYLDFKVRTFEEELLDEYLNNERGMYLYGSTGTGKTSFACILLAELMNRNKDMYKYPKFLDMRAIKYDIEQEYQQTKTIKDIIDRYTHTPLLVIDDFGVMIGTESYIQFISHIINHREQNNKRTIITSNKNLNWIGSNIDDRIASRITGLCDIIKFSGNDERLKKAKIKEIIL